MIFKIKKMKEQDLSSITINTEHISQLKDELSLGIFDKCK